MLTIDSMTENSYLTSRLEATNNEFLPLGCKDKVEEGYWRCDDRTHPYMVHWKKNGTETGYWSKKTFFVLCYYSPAKCYARLGQVTVHSLVMDHAPCIITRSAI